MSIEYANNILKALLFKGTEGVWVFRIAADFCADFLPTPQAVRPILALNRKRISGAKGWNAFRIGINSGGLRLRVPQGETMLCLDILAAGAVWA